MAHFKLLLNWIKVFYFSFSLKTPTSIVLDKIKHVLKTHLENTLGIGKVLDNAEVVHLDFYCKDSTRQAIL